MKGNAITRIPTVGQNNTVSLRAICAWTDTPAKREFCNVVVGSEGDYHDFQLIPKGDADNLTADIGNADLIPLGDIEVMENSALSGTACASGLTAGMLVFEDGEPEIPIPKGRRVFLSTIPSGDQATTLATTNLAQPNATKALSVNSRYYAAAVTVVPEDKVVQAIVLKNSEGHCACGAPKGRIVFPTCPCVIDGNDTPAVLAQVQAATEVTAIWELIEVPKDGAAESVAAGTKTTEGLTSGGSIIVQGGGQASVRLTGGFR